jgi:hypothetical protein
LRGDDAIWAKALNSPYNLAQDWVDEVYDAFANKAKLDRHQNMACEIKKSMSKKAIELPLSRRKRQLPRRTTEEEASRLSTQI